MNDDYLHKVLDGQEFLLFDGGMGTMLQRQGLAAGELPELLCLSDPRAITRIHRSYVEAGSQVITTNTFGANALKLKGHASVEQVFDAAIACARAAAPRYVAADIGPLGALLQPMGTLAFDEAYDLFAEQVRAAVRGGADLIIIETMADLKEMKAAVLAAKENSSLPIFSSMTFGEDGRTFLGTTPSIAARTLEALGVDALGVNCSLGPRELQPVVAEFLQATSKPVIVQANAGLPSFEDGITSYSIGPADYAQALAPSIEAGVGIVGGCCGTDPDYIAQVAQLIRGRKPAARTVVPLPCITSAQQELVLQGAQVGVIGERINPTGKKKLQAALRSGDLNYVAGEAVSQMRAGADVLDVNAGLPDIDEPAVLARLVGELQGLCPLPLQIDSADPQALQAAVRVYAGKPLINSVNGTQESLQRILPIAKHYGCAVVGLTLDEDGIPATAEGRLAIAERIVAAADEQGIARTDVFIDCLVLTASTNQAEVPEILRAIELVKERLDVRTVLGVSNVSFGLPERSVLNATFLAAAFQAGLDLPIMNPCDERAMQVVRSWRVLTGEDEHAARYIQAAAASAEADGGRDAHGSRGSRAQAGNSPAASANAPGEAGGVVGISGVAGDGNADAPGDIGAGPSGGAAGVGGTGGAGGAGVGGAGGAGDAGSSDVASGGAGASQDALQLLCVCVIDGLKGQAASLTEELLSAHDALQVINGVLIPALDEVGERFEQGSFFLPQLMSSAEAAKAAFDVIRAAQGASASPAAVQRGPIVLATVKGDIHDIGKNIVRMLLENYGYDVIDLGRDVAPQTVVESARENGAPIVGLSALMTTTLAAMQETIQLLRDDLPQVKVIAGGAVLNDEYARMVGADFYAKDAAEAARIVGELLGSVGEQPAQADGHR